ncbi:MAG: hypothetical protein MJ246_04665 [Clostridia bacterium]|nr:hypothetical protein [Clostridia bacterium]
MEFKKGDRVVILLENDFRKCFMGTVLESKESDEDWSYHGSPYYPVITRVLGDDGRTYSNGERYHVIFMDPKTAFNKIQYEIDEHNDDIKKLHEKQWLILNEEFLKK